MRFVLRLAARETRASWKRLVFFFVCVAIGVGAIVGLRSIIQNVRLVLQGEARALIAADIVVQSRQAWGQAAYDTIAARVAAAPVQARTDSIETATMVRPADETKAVAKMVELRGVQPEFPLYGRVVLDGGQAYSHALLAGRGALVRPELLAQLGVRISDAIVIGRDRFTIRGVLLSEPGRQLGAFSFGSRILVDYEDLRRTGLLAFGSRARYQVMLRVAEPGVTPLVRQLRQDFRDDYISIRSYHGRESDIGEDLQRAEDFLSLIGFVIAVLGGVGVWSVTRVFVQQKIKSIAVLKCVGATTYQILGAYLLQVGVLGVCGSLLGVGLAAAGLAAVPTNLGPGLPTVSYGLTGSAVVQGVGVGLLVSLLFSLVPLLEIRHVKPLLLLRHEAQRPRAGVDWIRAAAIVLVTAALVLLASWQAASLRAGLYVSGAFAGATVALHLAGLGLVRAVAPLARARWFPLRHAVLSLARPGNQTRVILLAVGLGSFFIIGVRTLQVNLVQEFELQVREDAPDMFLIDIQYDQAAGVRAFLTARAQPETARLIPVLRARVTGVRGREINLDGFEDVRGRGSLGREYVITYRDRLEANERILEGRFWDPSRPPEAEVSIEESIRERFRISVGDTMRFDVLGRTIAARVTSVRHVDWDDSRAGGFMFLFRPGSLGQAPHTYIAVLRGPAAPADRARFQRDLMLAFPNVSVVDGREVIELVRRIVDNVVLAISVVGGIALFSGVLILVGSVAMTKFQRLYEAAIFKTLGASTKTLAAMLVLEYGALGTLAGAVGSLGAIVLTWALCRYLLEIAWHPAPAQNLAGIALTALTVGAVGVGASLDVLRRKPLATLRAE